DLDTPARCDHRFFCLHRRINLIFDLQKSIRSSFFNNLPEQLPFLLLYHKICIDKPISQTLCCHNTDRTFSRCRHTYENEIFLHLPSSLLVPHSSFLEKTVSICISIHILSWFKLCVNPVS